MSGVDSFVPALDEYFWNSSDLLWVFNVGGKMGFTNPAWFALLGWDNKNLSASQFLDRVHPDDVERTTKEIQEQCAGVETSRAVFENRIRASDGSYRWIEWTSQRRDDVIYSTGRDATVRKEYLARLDASVETTKAVFAAAADLIVIIDRDSVVAESSPIGQNFFGYADQATTRASAFQIIHRDDRDEVAAALERTFEEGQTEVVTFRFRARHFDGHWMQVEARGRALHSSGESPTQAVFIARDVTAGVAAEASLAESRETTRAILDAAMDAIIVIDRDMTILESNPGAELIHGVPSEHRVGRQVTELVVNDDKVMVETSFRQAFDEDGAVGFRCRMMHVDGHIITNEIRGRTLRDADGPPTRLVFISRDISDTVAFEAALARSFSMTKAILDAAPDSIVVIGRDFVIIEASPGTELTYGHPKTKRMGHSAMTIVHSDDRAFVTKELERLFDDNNDELISYRFRAYHADGRLLKIETRGRRLRGDDSQPPRAVLVSRDVTESVAAEQALAIAKEEAERANAAKSEFMSRMSHELRTPLNSVLGFAQILQMELASPDARELVNHIYKSGQHLLTLINEVLDISWAESGTIGLSLEPVGLKALVDECLDIMRPQANDRGVSMGYGNAFEHRVKADHLRLKQVILNLLSNAIKYNRENGTVTLNCQAGSGHLRFCVTDTGHGIAPELHDRLFTAFDRLDAEARGIEGTGLGLTLSKNFVEAMGGALGYESAVDLGSTFWIELPLSETAPTPSLQ